MRRERRATNENAETIAYTFHFQITNKGGRQACSVKVQAPNIQDATTFFRQNWSMIETTARDGLVSRSGEDRNNRVGQTLIGDARLPALSTLAVPDPPGAANGTGHLLEIE